MTQFMRYLRSLVAILGCRTKGPADPWRCARCGSLSISRRIWVNSNTNVTSGDAEDRGDMWCDDCEEHTFQIRESELLRETVEPWWQNDTTIEDREVITGLAPESFILANDEQAFHNACTAAWSDRSNDQKITIWQMLTFSKNNTQTYNHE